MALGKLDEKGVMAIICLALLCIGGLIAWGFGGFLFGGGLWVLGCCITKEIKDSRT